MIRNINKILTFYAILLQKSKENIYIYRLKKGIFIQK